MHLWHHSASVHNLEMREMLPHKIADRADNCRFGHKDIINRSPSLHPEIQREMLRAKWSPKLRLMIRRGTSRLQQSPQACCARSLVQDVGQPAKRWWRPTSGESNSQTERQLREASPYWCHDSCYKGNSETAPRRNSLFQNKNPRNKRGSFRSGLGGRRDEGGLSDVSAIIQLPILSRYALCPILRFANEGPYIICLRLPIKERWIHSLNIFGTRDGHYCNAIITRPFPIIHKPRRSVVLNYGWMKFDNYFQKMNA